MSDRSRFAANLLLASLALLTWWPLLWMGSVSLMPAGESSNFPPPLLPSKATFSHYRELFSHDGMLAYLGNSLLLASAATVLGVSFNVCAGYAFAKLEFRGRKRLFRWLLAGLVIPSQVAMLPLFLLVKQMGLMNSYAAVLLPMLASLFGIFMVRQYALSIPDALLEAARMDGAGEFRIFFFIVLPLLKPILVTLAVFSFLSSWNDFMWPLIVLTDQGMYTLPLALASLSREHVADNELMMAGAVLTVLPALLLFLLLQRYYIQGLLLGSVKG